MLDRSQLTSEEVALRVLVALIRHHGCTKFRSQELVRMSWEITGLFSKESKELQARGKGDG